MNIILLAKFLNGFLLRKETFSLLFKNQFWNKNFLKEGASRCVTFCQRSGSGTFIRPNVRHRCASSFKICNSITTSFAWNIKKGFFCSVADPDPGSGAFLTPDKHPESATLLFWHSNIWFCFKIGENCRGADSSLLRAFPRAEKVRATERSCHTCGKIYGMAGRGAGTKYLLYSVHIEPQGNVNRSIP